MSSLISIAPVDLVICGALNTEGAVESPPNTNAGPYVERVLKRVGLKKGDPWCAAWLYDVGEHALPGLWPLPVTGGCVVLHEFAQRHKILYTRPERGDVFLIWHPKLGRMGHTGLMLDDQVDTLSGNTSGAGSREGWIVGRRAWSFTPQDRFVRWADLLTPEAGI